MLLFCPRNALPSFLLAFCWLLRRHHSLRMHSCHDETCQTPESTLSLSVSVLQAGPPDNSQPHLMTCVLTPLDWITGSAEARYFGRRILPASMFLTSSCITRSSQ